jgi:hypothetical protein
MAQADYVTSAIRTLITGGSANPSTHAATTGCNQFIMDLSGRAMCTLQHAVQGTAGRVA